MNRNKHRGLLTVIALSSLLALGACSRQEASPTAGTPPEAKSDTAVMGSSPSAKDVISASPLGERIDDAQIVSGIKAQFAGDKDISAMAIDVDSKEGMVTLSGVVTNGDAKVRADLIARQMKDVKSVNNQLEVKAG